VIPVRNEALTVAAIVAATVAYVPVIVVDDASDDGSGTLAAASGATVIRLPRHCGKGMALQRGFAEALRCGADSVVTLDGDGQHDPQDIPRFLAASRRWPGSIIIGDRLDTAAAIPRCRLQAIQVGSFWINWLGYCHVRDTQCGFRLYPAHILRTLSLKHGGFLLESEVLIKAGQAGYKVHEIPIRATYPPGRVSQYRPLRDGMLITAYLLYRGLRFWPAQLRLLCAARGTQDNATRQHAWRCARAAALATLVLPLLVLCVLTQLLVDRLGLDVLSPCIRWFYDQRRFVNPSGGTKAFHDHYQPKHWELV
jgi:glycosyltransferase involved in cell wall biosynthesis